MKLIIILLSLSLSISIHCQDSFSRSFSEKYDLDFERYGDAVWAWIEKRGNTMVSKSEYNSAKLSYKLYSDSSGMKFTLSKIVPLPMYEKADTCTITLDSKSENLTNAFFVTTSYDGEENIIYNDSIKLINGERKIDTISFKLSGEKVIKIKINYQGNRDSLQNFYPNRIDININGRSINNDNVYDTDNLILQELDMSIDRSKIIPLDNNDRSLRPVIDLVKNKKLIGLGECTHGSLTIKESIAHFSKMLIKEGDVKLLMVERPMDLLLKYDLFVQGHTEKEYIKQLEEDSKCYVDDSALFIDFLNWLRNYNKKRESKVHFIGIDGMPVPQLALYQYHIALLGEKAAIPYLKLIKERKYLDLIKLAEADKQFKKVGKKHFDFYRFVIESCSKEPDRNDREYNMAENILKAIEIFTTEETQAIIHMHSAHLEHIPLLNKNNLKATGYFLRSWYGPDFFTFTFQIGAGEYTNEYSVVSEQSPISLLKPLPQSFEGVASKTGFDYFFYPADFLGKEILFYNQIPRATITHENDKFGSLRKRFDGYVYMGYSTPLKNIEPFPTFYMSNYVSKNTKKIEGIMKMYASD